MPSSLRDSCITACQMKLQMELLQAASAYAFVYVHDRSETRALVKLQSWRNEWNAHAPVPVNSLRTPRVTDCCSCCAQFLLYGIMLGRNAESLSRRRKFRCSEQRLVYQAWVTAKPRKRLCCCGQTPEVLPDLPDCQWHLHCRHKASCAAPAALTYV